MCRFGSLTKNLPFISLYYGVKRMKKYAQIIDNETKLCNVGVGTNTNFYKSIGMELLDVEQAYDGQWYLQGYAPTKSDDVQALEELQKEQTSLETQIAELKDNLLTATLVDDTEQIESIKAKYQTLVGGE